MLREDGTHAFAYGTGDTPFLGGDTQKITLTITLTFEPHPDTSIKFWAIDESCGGGNSSGAVLGYTFRELTTRVNQLSYDAAARIMTFNGQTQRALPMGTPRFAWLEVGDGAPEGGRASYSYTIDLLHPDAASSK